MLILNSHTHTVQIQDQHLKLKPKWLEFVAYSAIKSLDNDPTVTPAEIRALGTWQNYNSDASVHAAISREHRKWQQHFKMPVFVGKFGKAFRLNPELQPQFVQPLEEIKHQLASPAPTLQRLENPNTESQSQLRLGQLYLERGDLEKAHSAFLAAQAARPNANLRCESIFWLARVQELLGLYEQSKQTIGSLGQELKKSNHKLDARARL
jgi:tetratricopeptide (TPR) repeat protein